MYYKIQFQTVRLKQDFVVSDQINVKLVAEFEEIKELLEILPDTVIPFLNDTNYYTKE